MASKSITERTRKSEADGKCYTLIVNISLPIICLIQDPYWVVGKHLPTFRIPNDQDVSSIDGSQWLEDMNILISYYSSILTCPFDKFWAEVKVLV